MTEPIPIGLVPAFHAHRDPHRACFSHNGLTVTRAEFEACANRRARALAAFGIGQDDRVIMLMANGVEFFETTFALWKLGATPVPVASTSTEGELRGYVDLIQPRAMIGAAGGGGAASEIPADLPIDAALSAEALPARVPRHWRIAMSGGSTGRPKAIVARTPAVLDPMAAMLGQKVDGVMLNPGPLYHSGPFGLSHRAVFAGNHVITMDRFDPFETLRLIEHHGVDWLYIVPTMMHRIWRLPIEERARHDLAILGTVFHMASACPAWLKEAWIDWLGPEKIWELYSGAENPGRCIISGTEWLAHRGSVGRVQPGATLAIFDEAGQPCAAGEIGEVCFQPTSDEFTFSYIGAEARMIGDYISLGDLGYLDADGFLYIVDRRTDLIVSGGVNLYPAEIEAALDAHPDVECSVAIGLPDADLGQRLHAIVRMSPASSGPATETDLRTFLADRLARYKIPRSFEFVAEPLKDGAGKVRRSALREQRTSEQRASAQATP